VIGRIEWELGPADQVHPLEVADRDGHMLIRWRDGQPPTPGMVKLLNALTNLSDDEDGARSREGPPRAPT
jgi:hypothetical protein